MPQYLLSVFQTEGAAPPTPEQAELMMARVAVVQDEMKAAGVWVFFGALTDASSATVVRPAPGGEVSMTDGPYAEAKEQIGGFTVIDAADLDEALHWARKGAEACMWPVEVRPFLGPPPV